MASFLLKWFSIETSYIVYLLIVLILTNIATHIKAKRFAYNVIALEIADNIRKGAALNAVQIAEVLINNNWL